MEKERIDIIGREDRENDLDDINLDEFHFEEGVDYKTYLEKVKESISDETSEMQDVQPRSKVQKKSSGKSQSKARKPQKNEREDICDFEYRNTLIAFMTTKQKGNALRIIAAARRKTLSTLINDSINAYLRAEIDEIIGLGILDHLTKEKG